MLKLPYVTTSRQPKNFKSTLQVEKLPYGWQPWMVVCTTEAPCPGDVGQVDCSLKLWQATSMIRRNAVTWGANQCCGVATPELEWFQNHSTFSGAEMDWGNAWRNWTGMESSTFCPKCLPKSWHVFVYFLLLKLQILVNQSFDFNTKEAFFKRLGFLQAQHIYT